MLSIESFCSTLRGWHRSAYAVATQEGTFAKEQTYDSVNSLLSLALREGDDLFAEVYVSTDEYKSWESLKATMYEVTDSCDLHRCGIPCGIHTLVLLQEAREQIGIVTQSLKDGALGGTDDED